MDVPIELGEAEFYDGDSITITEIRGSHATVAKGGTYVVKGRYHLASRDGARLLLSVTATEGSGRSETEPDSVTTVAKGDGEFTLVKRVDVAGYPHLTFYGADGHPFGGVYFGHGESLLGKKGWSYRTP